MRETATNNLHDKVRKVLMDEWDPIGISNEPKCADEYDNYIPRICTLLCRDDREEALYKHLRWIETSYIELTDTEESIAPRRKVVSLLMQLVGE